MRTSETLFLALLVLIALERIVELFISKRNAKTIIEKGGKEHGAGHYPVMVVLHTAIFPACFAEVLLLDRQWSVTLAACMGALLCLTMALRYWAISSLGPFWNTRVIVLPNAEVVRKGPYRWMRHPNYLAVIVELAAIPLFHGAWLSAVFFSVANAFLLFHRIRVEESILQTYCQDSEELHTKKRFSPF